MIDSLQERFERYRQHLASVPRCPACGREMLALYQGQRICLCCCKGGLDLRPVTSPCCPWHDLYPRDRWHPCSMLSSVSIDEHGNTMLIGPSQLALFGAP